MRTPAARTILALVAASAMWLSLLLWTFTGTAVAGPGDLLTTTTTVLTDPGAALEALIAGATGDDTTTTTSTSTTTTSTTSTTIAEDGDGDTGQGSGGTTATNSSNSGSTIHGSGSGAPVVAVTNDAVNNATSRLPAAASETARGRIDDALPRTVAAVPTVAAPKAGMQAASLAVPPVPMISGRSTSAILGRLAGLDLGPAALARLLAPFPVAGQAYYSDDFGADRHVPYDHSHEGTDVFSTAGTPVIASADGTVGRMTVSNPISGTALRVTTKGGTYFFYAHLDHFAPGLSDGDTVEKGDVLGFVGTTGNAEGTAPHLHYEIHPLGGAAVDPVPYLDQWLADAERSIESVRSQGDLALHLPTSATSSGTRHARSGGATSAAAAPATTDLGPAQTISAGAIAPAGIIVMIIAGVLLVKRVRRRPAPWMR